MLKFYDTLTEKEIKINFTEIETMLHYPRYIEIITKEGNCYYCHVMEVV